jgi:hypothetical protein
MSIARPLRDVSGVCLRGDHLRRTLAIALVVGTWLRLFNQGDRLAAGAISAALLGKVLLNFVTPFLVSNWGLLSRDTDH